MSIKSKFIDDPRIEKILDLVLQLARGNLDARCSINGTGDELDAILGGLNMLAEELQSTVVSYKTTRDRLDNIIQSMVDSLIVVNSDAAIQMVNNATLDLLGYTEDELIGKPIDTILQERRMKALRKKSIDSLIEKRFYKGVERIYLKKDGDSVQVNFSSSIISNNHGKIQGIVCVAQDITERKHAEQIKASLKEKETLLKEIHHRVKNNMAVISGLLFLQIEDIEDEKTKQVLQDIQNRVHTISLIHETLCCSDSLASIDMQTYLSKLGEIILQGYNVAGKVNLKVEAENITIGVKQATPLGLIVNELITNSLKYAFPDDRKGEIVLKLKSNKENEAELTVSDNGLGIPEGFDLQNADSLGLKLVKVIAESQLDGSIDMENKNGTKFIIKFNNTET